MYNSYNNYMKNHAPSQLSTRSFKHQLLFKQQQYLLEQDDLQHSIKPHYNNKENISSNNLMAMSQSIIKNDNIDKKGHNKNHSNMSYLQMLREKPNYYNNCLVSTIQQTQRDNCQYDQLSRLTDRSIVRNYNTKTNRLKILTQSDLTDDNNYYQYQDKDEEFLDNNQEQDYNDVNNQQQQQQMQTNSNIMQKMINKYNKTNQQKQIYNAARHREIINKNKKQQLSNNYHHKYDKLSQQPSSIVQSQIPPFNFITYCKLQIKNYHHQYNSNNHQSTRNNNNNQSTHNNNNSKPIITLSKLINSITKNNNELKQQLQTINKLTITNCLLNSLQGIEMFKQLQEINLRQNQLRQVSQLYRIQNKSKIKIINILGNDIQHYHMARYQCLKKYFINLQELNDKNYTLLTKKQSINTNNKQDMRRLLRKSSKLQYQMRKIVKKQIRKTDRAIIRYNPNLMCKYNNKQQQQQQCQQQINNCNEQQQQLRSQSQQQQTERITNNNHKKSTKNNNKKHKQQSTQSLQKTTKYINNNNLIHRNKNVLINNNKKKHNKQLQTYQIVQKTNSQYDNSDQNGIQQHYSLGNNNNINNDSNYQYQHSQTKSIQSSSYYNIGNNKPQKQQCIGRRQLSLGNIQNVQLTQSTIISNNTQQYNHKNNITNIKITNDINDNNKENNDVLNKQTIRSNNNNKKQTNTNNNDNIPLQSTTIISKGLLQIKTQDLDNDSDLHNNSHLHQPTATFAMQLQKQQQYNMENKHFMFKNNNNKSKYHLPITNNNNNNNKDYHNNNNNNNRDNNNNNNRDNSNNNKYNNHNKSTTSLLLKDVQQDQQQYYDEQQQVLQNERSYSMSLSRISQIPIKRMSKDNHNLLNRKSLQSQQLYNVNNNNNERNSNNKFNKNNINQQQYQNLSQQSFLTTNQYQNNNNNNNNSIMIGNNNNNSVLIGRSYLGCSQFTQYHNHRPNESMDEDCLLIQNKNVIQQNKLAIAIGFHMRNLIHKTLSALCLQIIHRKNLPKQKQSSTIIRFYNHNNQ